MEDPDAFLNVSLLDFEGDVEEQVNSLLQRVRLSRCYVEGLRHLFGDLMCALRDIWPGIEVHPFGSIVTGLGIKSSDVDIYANIQLRYNDSIETVMRARNILRRRSRLFTNVFAIPHAKVPIVKFLYIPTCSNCDVNFSSESGVRNSKLIFNFFKTDQKVLTLAIVVKYWSKVFKFTGTNLLPNYALTLLVIFYLQSINALAPVAALQKNIDPYMVDGWNTAFVKEFHALQPRAYHDNIYHLLGGFFKYYSVFRFDLHVVNIYLGIPALRSIFGGPAQDLSNFSLYNENLSTRKCKPLRIDTLMCIQDPFEHNRNCAEAVSKKLFGKVMMHFQHAARMYDHMAPNDFLKAVLTQNPQFTIRAPLEMPRAHIITVPTISKKKNHRANKKIKNMGKMYRAMEESKKVRM